MNTRLISILLTLATVVGAAHAAQYKKTGVYDITTGKDVYVDRCSESSEYGFTTAVSKADCKGAGTYIGLTATATGSVTPTVHSVKYKSSDHVYSGVYLANCGGGVYVKVIGTGQFDVFYET